MAQEDGLISLETTMEFTLEEPEEEGGGRRRRGGEEAKGGGQQNGHGNEMKNSLV